MDGPWKHFGKQVFYENTPMADAQSEAVAEFIVKLCNAAHAQEGQDNAPRSG